LALRERRSHARFLATREKLRLGNYQLHAEPLEDRRLLSVSTTTTLHNFPSTTEFGERVDLVARVTTSPASSWNNGPTGTVTFWLDGVGTGTNLGTANVSRFGTARLSTNDLPVGVTDQVFAQYSGDSNFDASQTANPVTETVTAADTRTTLTASSNPG